jgi:mevalonate kinase
MMPEDFNRMQNTSRKDFEEFVAWLKRMTLAEARAACGDAVATKTAWLSYFRRGLKAELLLGELMEILPSVLSRVGYSHDELRRAVETIRTINFDDLGIKRTERGLRVAEG